MNALAFGEVISLDANKPESHGDRSMLLYRETAGRHSGCRNRYRRRKRPPSINKAAFIIEGSYGRLKWWRFARNIAEIYAPSR